MILKWLLCLPFALVWLSDLQVNWEVYISKVKLSFWNNVLFQSNSSKVLLYKLCIGLNVGDRLKLLPCCTKLNLCAFQRLDTSSL